MVSFLSKDVRKYEYFVFSWAKVILIVFLLFFNYLLIIIFLFLISIPFIIKKKSNYYSSYVTNINV